VLSQLERVAAAAASQGVARLQAADRANVIRQGEIGRQASVVNDKGIYGRCTGLTEVKSALQRGAKSRLLLRLGVIGLLSRGE
jgi:hypothetical protein